MSRDTARTVLEGMLERYGATWTDADRDRAHVIVEDSLRLAARAAAGVDVDREVAQVRAQLASIAAGAEIAASTIVRETVDAVLGMVVDRVLGPRR